MDKRSRFVLDIIIYISLVLISISVVSSNRDNLSTTLLICAVLIGSFSLRRSIGHYWSKYRYASAVCILLDTALIYTIGLVDRYETSQLFFYSLLADIMILYFSYRSLLLSLLCYFSYFLIIYIRYIKNNFFDYQYFLSIAFNKSFYFFFIFGVIYFARYQIHQKSIQNNTMEELKTSTALLELTNKKLNETMGKLEEMTVLKERNRIAREIHDTVGHTLTTVLVEIEAGKRLINRNPSLSMEKLNLAQEQVRKGLNNIRQSVKTLQDGSDILAFIPSLYSLVQETEKHTGVTITCILSQIPSIRTEYEKVIYRALQEGLTNGIRHGKSTEFICRLEYMRGKILFSLKDNGIGCDEISPGFGLTTMKQRVEEIGGSLSINTSAGSGCYLEITIPLEEDEHEPYTDTCGG